MDERLRVVIADDEPRARQFLEKLLSEHDEVEVVGVAKGGGERWRRSRRRGPTPCSSTSTCRTYPGSRWRGT
jgi:CheY-like chemotaxis protein